MKSGDGGMEMGHLDWNDSSEQQKKKIFYMIQVTMFVWYYGKNIWASWVGSNKMKKKT